MSSWILVDKDAYPAAGSICTRCGAREAICLPVSIDSFLAFNKSFVRQHKRCRQAASGREEGGAG